jgi:replicative DNA helicase
MGINEIKNIELEPQNIEVEKKFLSCVFNNYETMNKTILTTNDFYDTTNKKIFKTILDKKTVDITVISNEIGNTEYIQELASDFIVNYEDFEKIIKEKSYKRYINNKLRTLK